MDDFSMTNIDSKQFGMLKMLKIKVEWKRNEKRNGMFGQIPLMIHCAILLIYFFIIFIMIWLWLRMKNKF